MVSGCLAEEAVDKSGEIFDYATSKPLFQEWSADFEKRTAEAGQEVSKGNLRAMHGSVAAGKFTQMVFDDDAKKILVAAHVVDRGEWEKCERGVYTGFSIGGKYEKQWLDEQLKKIRYTARPAEGSIVDNACMYGATFTAIKADGAEELRKFVGSEPAKPADPPAPEPIKKDASALATAADQVLEGLKGLLAEAAMMEGDPSVWTLHDIAEAISRVLSVKGDAKYQIVEQQMDASMPMEMAAPVADLAKAADSIKATAETLEKFIPGITETLTKFAADVAAVAQTPKAMEDGLAKTVGDTVSKAVETAAGELRKGLSDLGERVKVCEARPAQAGTPVRRVEKAIGGPTPETAPPSVDEIKKFLNAARRSGVVSEASLRELTIFAASAVMP